MTDILKVALGGTPKTRIMYKSFLSYQQLQDYLALMFESKLLEMDKVNVGQKTEQIIFRTTDNGKKFIELNDKMNVLCNNKLPQQETRVLKQQHEY